MDRLSVEREIRNAAMVRARTPRKTGKPRLGRLNTPLSRSSVAVTHGEGPYVIDMHGQRYLDANSGLWNMVAGFDHPGLAEAAKAQYDRFPGYHSLFGRMSDQTVMLSEKLIEVSPFERGQVFYTNSGLRSE